MVILVAEYQENRQAVAKIGFELATSVLVNTPVSGNGTGQGNFKLKDCSEIEIINMVFTYFFLIWIIT